MSAHGFRFLALCVVSAAFAVAGALKLMDPARFASDIGNYRLVPPLAAAVFALYLPWLEIALAAGLWSVRLRQAARLLALGLLVVFCGALVSTLARGLDIRCGCFGGSGGGVTAGWALTRNIGLIALLFFAGAGKPVASRAGTEVRKNSN